MSLKKPTDGEGKLTEDASASPAQAEAGADAVRAVIIESLQSPQPPAESIGRPAGGRATGEVLRVQAYECPEGVFLPIYRKIQLLLGELKISPEEAGRMLSERYADQFPEDLSDEDRLRIGKSLMLLEEIMKAIPGSHFIFQKVKESLVKKTALKKGQLEDGTMMMADISGFTSLMEKSAKMGKVGVANVYEKINKIFSKASSIVAYYKGKVMKYGGDAFTVHFHGREAENRAKACALALQEMMGQIGEEDGPDALKLSIGLTSDKFYLGIIGEDERRDLVIGGKGTENMEKAETAAGPGEILFMNPDNNELERVTQMPAIKRGLDTDLSIKLRDYIDTLPPERDGTAIARAIDRLSGIMISFAPQGTSDQLLRMNTEPEWTSGSTAVFIKLDGIDYHARDESEALSANEELDDIYGIIHKQVTEYKGRIDKFGPSLLVRFFPLGKTGGSARRAYECANKIMASLSQKSSARLKIGVATGNMLMGEFGARAEGSQYEYTVMGDPVNFAARLMARAAEGEILITPEVYRNISDRIEECDKRTGSFKGKEGELEYFCVGGWREIYGLDTAYYLETASSIYGRDDELKKAQSIISEALSGKPGTLILEGEAGLGKTKLLKHILKRCHEQKMSIHGASSEIEDQKRPYGLWKNIIGNIMDLDPAAPPHENIRKASLVLRLFGLEDTQFASPILSLLGFINEPFPTSMTGEAIRVLLENLSKQKPLTIALEDLHWGDHESLEIFEFLSRTITDGRILFIGTTRQGKGFSESYENHIDLERLKPADVQDIAKDILTREDSLLEPLPRDTYFSEQLTDYLFRVSAGNPLFAEETVYALLRKEYLKYGHFEPVKPLPSDAGISPEMKSLIEGRIKFLTLQGVFTEATHEVLHILAVIGNNAPADLLNDLINRNNIPPAALEKELRHLTENRFIERQGGQLRFRHDKIREAMEEMLSPKKLIHLHGQAVQYLENADGPGVNAERIFHHSHQILHGYGLDERHDFAKLAREHAEARPFIRKIFNSAVAVSRSLAAQPGYQRAIIAYCEDALAASDYLRKDPREKRDLLLEIARQLTSTEAGDELKKAIDIYSQCLEISSQIPETPDELVARLDIIARKMEPAINLAAYEPGPFYEMYRSQQEILGRLKDLVQPDDPIYKKQLLLAERNHIFSRIYEAYQIRSDKEASGAILQPTVTMIDDAIARIPAQEFELKAWFFYLKARVYRDMNESGKCYQELDPALKSYEEHPDSFRSATLVKSLYVLTSDQCFAYGHSINSAELMDRATELAKESLRFFRERGAINAECLALEKLSHFAAERGMQEERIRWAEKGYSKAKDYKLSGRLGIALINMAAPYALLGQPDKGRPYYDELVKLIPAISQESFRTHLEMAKKAELDPFYLG